MNSVGGVRNVASFSIGRSRYQWPRCLPCSAVLTSPVLFPQTNSCPLCRLELPTDNPEYEEYKQDREMQTARASLLTAFQFAKK
ncbi:hypothetical protein chiPu_0024123 [Chiloscyllium punctatum]|uniref:Uncharacterized protein n=1 Tax=Chiloscyllium punctatum TaxID=137246 RepID=A0A401TC59_CHIPU|nr:hypothetical protein [Chiloscyllium punctatum]